MATDPIARSMLHSNGTVGTLEVHRNGTYSTPGKTYAKVKVDVPQYAIYTGSGYIQVDNNNNVISTNLHAGDNISIDENGAITSSNDEYVIVPITVGETVKSGRATTYAATSSMTFQELYDLLVNDRKKCYAAFSLNSTFIIEFTAIEQATLNNYIIGSMCYTDGLVVDGTESLYLIRGITVMFDAYENIRITTQTFQPALGYAQLPQASPADDGKTVVLNYPNWELTEFPKELPDALSLDRYKVLGVLDGAWTAIDLYLNVDLTDITLKYSSGLNVYSAKTTRTFAAVKQAFTEGLAVIFNFTLNSENYSIRATECMDNFIRGSIDEPYNPGGGSPVYSFHTLAVSFDDSPRVEIYETI